MNESNPSMLRQCSEPKSEEQSSSDWDAFVEAVYAARIQYRIPHLVLGAEMNVLYGDGNEGVVFGKFAAGDQFHAETIAAWLLGQCGAERQEITAKAIGSHRAVKRKENRA